MAEVHGEEAVALSLQKFATKKDGLCKQFVEVRDEKRKEADEAEKETRREGKRCPILHFAWSWDNLCHKEGCAWWSEEAKKCALVALAENKRK